MAVFLGIDTGATKTHAMLADENGTMLGFGQAGTGNHEVVGYEGVKAALSQAFTAACSQAGIRATDVRGAGFGIAGYDFPSERADTLDAIAVLGLDCPLELVNDVTLGVPAGTTHGWGIAVDAGTGNNVRGLDRHDREGWVTGCGTRFGEFGGAGDIVGQAIVRVAHHWSLRGKPTSLSNAFMQEFGAATLTDLIEGLTQGVFHPSARHAPLVFEQAKGGDAIALEVVQWCAAELGQTVLAVARQLDLLDQAFEVVKIGSVFRSGDIFSLPLHETVLKQAPLASFHRLEVPPVMGAVILGMHAGGLSTGEIRPRLIKSILPED